MGRVVLPILGAMAGMALVVAGLWAWQESRDLVLDWGASRPDVAAWAVRSGAIAAVAAAQVLLISTVLTRAFRRAVFDNVLRLLGGVVFALAAVTALACGAAGR